MAFLNSGQSVILILALTMGFGSVAAVTAVESESIAEPYAGINATMAFALSNDIQAVESGLLSLPNPWPEGTIAPTMRAYRIRNGREVKLDLPYTSNCAVDIQRLRNGGYLNTWRVVFIVHGFRNNIDSPWMQEIKTAMLRVQPDITVIIVGWGGGSNLLPWRYLQAASNIQTVGRWLGKRVARIRREASRVACIWGVGHSLGSHVLGMAGKTSNRGVTRITGLDPAGPAFERVNQDIRLKKTDATKMVDVIHTDGYAAWWLPGRWVAPVRHYGTLIPLGSIDFYPNYGYHQPGTGTTIGGSHTFAIKLFTWSINHRGRFATNTVLARAPEFERPVRDTRMSSYRAEMGYYADQQYRRGLYYKRTRANPPYA